MIAGIDVRRLRVEVAGSGADIVSDISLSISPGEVLGLVGESGSGKTTIATAMLGATRRGATITSGEIVIANTDLLSLPPKELREARGRLIAYVPQDPSAALNPALRVETQLDEVLRVHDPTLGRRERRDRMIAQLEEVNLSPGGEFLTRYPHQMSGGQQQRVCIAMAFLLKPPVIVLDEPTTGLDVTTQSRILDLVSGLCRDHEVAALYVSHDLAAVASLADRVMVMYAGRVAELGPTPDIFQRPAHPYTRKLLAAIPDVGERRLLHVLPGGVPSPGRRPQGCFFAPRCDQRVEACTVTEPAVAPVAPDHVACCHLATRTRSDGASVSLPTVPGVRTRGDVLLDVVGVDASYGENRVLSDVSLTLREGETLALVGESGSGKTTIARSIVGLMGGWTGSITYRGEELATRARQRPSTPRREIQYIFQSPYNSLNPRHSVEQILTTPLKLFYGVKGKSARVEIADALERVSLPSLMMRKYPDQLSGGERQRVSIARALVCKPTTLICDEITSALDVSVQAAIVELLADLKRENALSMLFITHDLALVRSVADRIVVMYGGQIVEGGDTEVVLTNPNDQYTRRLLEHTPSAAVAAGLPRGGPG